MKYSPELAQNYSEQRRQFNETDTLLFEKLEEIGIQGKTVLELGCGDGRHAAAIREMGAAQVVGMDVSEEMIRIAKRRSGQDSEGLGFVVANGDRLPLPSSSVDRVVSNFVVHYFPKSADVFNEIGRVLKGGGYFIGTFNVTEVEPGYEHLYNQQMPIRLGQGEGSVVVYNLIKSRQEIEAAIKAASLTIVEEEVLDHPNATIDENFLLKDRIHKHATMFVLKKQPLTEAARPPSCAN